MTNCRSEKSKLTHLSLFTGIGGLDLSAEWAGFETVGQCEYADYPTKVLERHWPNVPRWRDIRTLTGGDFFERSGLRTVDVISGGFPCQPFSVAGRRRGRDDDRYLWPEMLRVISEIRPAWVIGENVAGIVSMAEPVGDLKVESRTIGRNADEDYYDAVSVQQEHMLLDGILQDIQNVGYEVQPFVIPACGVGAPHKRNRIFIVGYTDSCGCGGDDGRRQSSQSTNRCTYVSDTKSQRRSLCNGKGKMRQPRFEYCCEEDGQHWWAAEPDVGRVAHGIPVRVDRLRGLGNAVVPYQAYPVFKAIADIERGHPYV